MAKRASHTLDVLNAQSNSGPDMRLSFRNYVFLNEGEGVFSFQSFEVCSYIGKPTQGSQGCPSATNAMPQWFC